ALPVAGSAGMELRFRDQIPENVVRVVAGDDVARQQHCLVFREVVATISLRVLSGVEQERHGEQTEFVHGVDAAVQPLEECGIYGYPVPTGEGAQTSDSGGESAKVRRGEEDRAKVLAGAVREVLAPLIGLRQVRSIPTGVGQKEEGRAIAVLQVATRRSHLD